MPGPAADLVAERGMTPARPAPAGPPAARPARARTREPWWDLAACAALALAAAIAAQGAPGGSPIRLALSAPALLFVPGYLLLEASLPPRAVSRSVRTLVSVGTSLPVVGLLALLTAIAPGGFRPEPIVWTVAAGSLLLAGAAGFRRWRRVRAARRDQPGQEPYAEAQRQPPLADGMAEPLAAGPRIGAAPPGQRR